MITMTRKKRRRPKESGWKQSGKLKNEGRKSIEKWKKKEKKCDKKSEIRSVFILFFIKKSYGHRTTLLYINF